MDTQQRAGIRRKVALAMLAVAMVPLAVVAAVAYQSQRDAAERDAVERLTGIAAVQESRVEAFARSSIENLGQISSRTQLRRSLLAEIEQPDTANVELMNRILADAAAASENTMRIELADVDGVVRASSDGVGIGETRSQEPEFVAGLNTPVISNVVSSPEGTIGRHATPITLDDIQLGVALVDVSLDPLQDLIADYTGLGKTGESVLIGRTGDDTFELIGPLREADAYNGQAIVTARGDQAAIGRGQALTDGRYEQATDYRGETVIASTGPVDAVDGWGLIVKIDRGEALADADRLGRILLLAVFFAVALVVVTALVLARTLSRPVLELRDAAVAVRHGDTARRALVRGNDELTDLAIEFNRMTDELTEANTRLTRSNEQLEEFVYISSHDLKSPLRSIASFGQLLDQQYGQGLDGPGREYLGFIRNSAARMHSVIDDLLEYLRVEKQDHDAGPVALDAVFDSVCSLHRPALLELDAKVDIERPLPTVAGSEVLLRQVFDNIMQNAIRYHDPSRPLHVRVRAVTRGADTAVSVADNGVGVPPDRREEAFEVFRRLSSEGTGTGMGLAICRRIARRHGGDVSIADSDLGDGESGVTLIVILPAWP